MKCNIIGCPMTGRMVYCLDYRSKKYNFKNCPFYNITLDKENPKEERLPMTDGLMKKIREDGL